jgi:hypothetical protein
MITLTSDKHALLKAGFSISDSEHQGPRWSTPRQETDPRGFTPPGKAIKTSVGLCGVMGRNSACQKALYMRLLATVRRQA